MKLAILGASVSQQGRNHVTGQVTGYSEALRVSYSEKIGFSEVKQFTYGGNRASDGGLVQSLAVREYRPDVCIFEPNIEDISRGTSVTENELVFIYRNILESGAKPLTLLLPDNLTLNPATRPQFAFLQSVSEKFGIPVATIDLRDVPNSEKLLAGVHTTPIGGEYYAKIIASELTNLIAAGHATVDLDKMATPLRYKIIPKEPGDRGLHYAFQIDFPEHSAGAPIRIIQKQRIGAFSPVLDILNGVTCSSRSVWDQYCHFERESYVVLFSGLMEPGGNLEISVSDKNPMYHQCRREDVTWPKPEDRYLNTLGDIFIFCEADFDARSVPDKALDCQNAPRHVIADLPLSGAGTDLVEPARHLKNLQGWGNVRMTGMNISLVGNCQTRSILSILSFVFPTAKFDVIDFADARLSSKEARAGFADRLGNADLIITQPNSFEFVAADEVKRKFPEKTIVIGNFYFRGYHPDLCFFGETSQRSGELGGYHSWVLLASYLRGQSPQQALKNFSAEWYEAEGLLDGWKTSVDELRRRDVNADVPIADLVDYSSRMTYSFFTINHPRLFLVAEHLREALGQMWPKGIDASALPDPLYDRAIACVPDSIAEALQLPFRTPQQWKIGGKWIDLAEVVNIYYRLYERQNLRNSPVEIQSPGELRRKILVPLEYQATA